MRNNRSLLWNYFFRCDTYAVDHKVTCNACNSTILTSGNTSNMKMHLQTRHSEQEDNIYQTYLDEVAEKAMQNSAASTSTATVERNEGKL